MSSFDGFRRFRVLSYNIHKGFTVRNKSFVLREIRDAIRSVSPDFVFLQEVLGEHSRHRSRIEDWPSESQFEYMAEQIWPHFTYGRNAIYEEGHHGNAILSKYPILFWENEDVSTSTLERRGILHAVVQPTHTRPELHLLCVHFGLLERDRQLQARRLCSRVLNVGRRMAARNPEEATEVPGIIAAGDFNDWGLRLSKIFKKEVGFSEAYFARHHRHARTFPARLPIFQLDRIYFDSQCIEVKFAKCLHTEPWTRLSDHAALVADFEWK
jgi:endonuclease/exonuclease/phosphatase family metal-dependent hydrolase